MSEIIKCPNCGHSIDINKALSDELGAKFEAKQKEFEIETLKKRKEWSSAFEDLKKQKADFDEKLKIETEKAIQKELAILENTIKTSTQKEYLLQMQSLQKELNEKTQKISEFHLQTAQFEQLKRQNIELEAKYKAQAEATINEKLKLERESIAKTLTEENELKFKQKDEELNLLKKEIDRLNLKSQTSSQQLTGETQELAIEEWLRVHFPLDEIEEIKKGSLGADCLQMVNTRHMIGCGKIYYESKRTKSFQPSWIEKFKRDMREKGADIGILVTQTMPQGLERMSLIDGVWVCTFTEFKGLCAVIRENIIELAQTKTNIQNRGEKMQMLFSYLTGNEFKMQVEAIVEAFITMQNDLESEKRSMMRIWKSREKQIEKAHDNAINMYASIKGIAGSKIAKIDILELSYENSDLK